MYLKDIGQGGLRMDSGDVLIIWYKSSGACIHILFTKGIGLFFGSVVTNCKSFITTSIVIKICFPKGL
jgi:hypothetical protein